MSVNQAQVKCNCGEKNCKPTIVFDEYEEGKFMFEYNDRHTQKRVYIGREQLSNFNKAITESLKRKKVEETNG